MFLKSKFKSTVDENQMSSDVEICIEKQVCKVAKVKGMFKHRMKKLL